MMPDRRQIVTAFAGAILLRLLFHHLTGFTLDDAFITFRYAENIAAGMGFVYNAGEKVLGTTTPLFTLMLATLVGVGIPVMKGALLVSLLFSGLTAVILLRLAQSLGFAQFSFVPVTLYIFFPRLLATDTAGMESALFALLVTAAFYLQRQRLTMHAIVAAALASITRPEGLLVLVILTVYNGVKQPRRVVTFIVTAALIILPWVVFAYYYFGSPISNSVAAKLALYSRLPRMSFWDSIVFLLGWHHPFGVPLFILVVAGGWWLRKQQQFGWLEIVWMAATIGSLALSPTHLFLWYITPIYPLYLLFAGAAFPLVCERIKWLSRHADRGKLVLVGTLLVLVVANYRTVISYRSYQNNQETVYRAIGLYLRDHADAADVVAAEDIGYMGYYSGLTIIDRDGLISPEVVPYNRSGDYLGVVLDYRPDWVVACPPGPSTTFIDSSRFVDRYRLRASFPTDSGPVYLVFSLIE